MISATVCGKIIRIDTATDTSGKTYYRGTIVDSVRTPNGEYAPRYTYFRSWGSGPLSKAAVGDMVTVVGDLSVSVYNPANGEPRPNIDVLVRSSQLHRPSTPKEHVQDDPDPRSEFSSSRYSNGPKNSEDEVSVEDLVDDTDDLIQKLGLN